nr:MAG TPA: outer membrane protein assembly factor [Caudoviricetes sp.]
MKRSFLAVWACSLALSLTACWRTVIDLGFRAYRRARDWAVDAVRYVAPKLPSERLPATRIDAAVEFVLRMVKRDRPVIQARWRMCPSA